MNLFVNCCPREESRTRILADALLRRVGDYEEIDLYKINIFPLKPDTLKRRTELISEGKLGDSAFLLAKQFASADTVVIAAPYWDSSFPAMLKVYIENIYVTGIVSKYSENGQPVGLCRAKKLYYVTTAGGPYDARFSYDYLSTVAKEYFGIRETLLIKAEMLDVVGSDVDRIMSEAIDEIGRIQL